MMNRSYAPLLHVILLLLIGIPLWVQSREETVIDLLSDKSLPEFQLSDDELHALDKSLGAHEILEDDQATNPQDSPGRSVRIDLGKVPDASFYQVQVIPYKRAWLNPLQFSTPDENPLIRLRLNPGHYQIRARSLSEKKMPGAWGAYKSFWIHFSAVQNSYPPPNSTIATKSDKEEILTFEWPKQENARYYLYSLKDHTGKSIRLMLTRKNWIREPLKVFNQYYWSVHAVQSKEEAYRIIQGSALTYSRFVLKKSENLKRPFSIKVSPNKMARKYQFEVMAVSASDDTEEPSIVESFSPQLTMNLTPGEYEIRSRYVLEGDTPSEWSAPSKFFLKRDAPRPLLPLAQETVEPTDDLASQTRFEWIPDSGAARYEFHLFDSDGQLISTHTTQDSWIYVKLVAGQRYKWSVTALSPREKSASVDRAPASAVDFKVNEYIKLSLSSSEESSQLYGWAHQNSALSKLTASNYDLNSLVSQTLYAGANELALGYWHRQSRLGALIQASSSGIILDGAYHAYNSLGLHIGYRHLLSSGARLRFWLGYTYKELPDVLTHPFTNEVNVSLIKSMGPELRLSYFISLTEKLGLQTQAAFYRSLQDLGTPNGLPQNFTSTFKASIFATYRSSELSKWLMGYTYGVDHAEYETTDPIDIDNSVDISGHYLSLMYEFGLQEKMK